jgi:hypothetical protein
MLNPALTRFKIQAILTMTGLSIGHCPRNTIQHFTTKTIWVNEINFTPPQMKI